MWTDPTQCRPRRLEQNSQDLLENLFLVLKKKPLETSLSLWLDMNMESCRTDYHQLLSYSQWGILVLKLSWYWSYKEVNTVGSGTKISEEPEASIALLSHRTGAIQGWPEPHFLNFSQIIWLIDYHCIFCKATGIIKDIRAGVQKDKGWEWESGLETKWGEKMDEWIKRLQVIYKLSSLNNSTLYPYNNKNNNNELRALKYYLRKGCRNGFKGVYTKLPVWYIAG